MALCARTSREWMELSYFLERLEELRGAVEEIIRVAGDALHRT